MSDTDIIHADLTAIMEALGISTHARPYSMHEVVHRDVLPEIDRLRSALARVRKLHSRRDVAAFPGWYHDGDELSSPSPARVECTGCGWPWPCPTRAAADGPDE